MRWPLLLLPLLCFTTWSCNQAGKSVAGGEGDPSLFDQIPPIPSPPVVLGNYTVLCTSIVTAPVGNPPERFDRYEALNDTTIINIAAGPSSNTLIVKGLYLDPRIDDSVMLRDRGSNLWLGTGGFGPTAFNIQILTDNSGAVQEYIVTMISTGTSNATITTRRIFAPTSPAVVLSPGLKLAQVSACTKPPPNQGDFFNMIISGGGLCQWEPDTFEQKYRFNPAIGLNEAQTTTYDTSKNPANVEHDYRLNALISFAINTETEHSGGAVDRVVDYLPPPGGISPIDASGKWEGKSISPNGIFQSSPYILRNQISDVMFTVNSPGLTVTVTANGTWNVATHTMTGGKVDVFQIIRLDSNQMIAIHKIDKYTYDIFTLIRDESPGAGALTPHTVSGDNKTFTVQRFTNSTLTGSYSVGSAASFPLSWYP